MVYGGKSKHRSTSWIFSEESGNKSVWAQKSAMGSSKHEEHGTRGLTSFWVNFDFIKCIFELGVYARKVADKGLSVMPLCWWLVNY